MSPSRWIAPALCALAFALAPAAARADPELTWRDGPDMAGVSIGVSADGGAWISDGWAAGAGGPGVEFTLYWHGEWDDEGLAVQDATALAPFAPLAIPIFLTVIPKGALLGNETGMRVRAGATYLPSEGGERSALRVSLGFVGRSAPDESHVRSTSFAGALLPELGVAWVPGERSAFTMGWNPFALAFRVGPRTAFEWRIATVQLMFPMDRGDFVASVGTGVSVELDLDPRHPG